jgi:murein DD-endopeptidase MepM/ murein hydrolase activator NlpD
MPLLVFPVAPSGRPEFADAFGLHRGTDIFAPEGTPVFAVDSGNARATEDPKGGTVLYLTSTDGTVYYYAHLAEYVGSYPRNVQAGEILATVGTTGNAQGKAPHLHFEIHPKGKEAIDPYPELLKVDPSRSEKLPVPVAPVPPIPINTKKKRAHPWSGLFSWALASRQLQPTFGVGNASVRGKP